MRTTLDRIDIIDVRVYVLVEIGVVDHRYFYRCTVFVGIQVNHLADERCTSAVDITNKLTQTLLRVELLALALFYFGAILQGLLLHHAFVLQHNLDACVQERQLAHTVGQYLPMINGLREDRVVRPELHKRTRLALLPVAYRLCLGNRVHRCQRFTLGVVLRMNLTVAVYLYVHLGRQRIHAAHTYTVQTTRHFITVLVELTTGVQHGHYHLQRTLVLLRMHIYRNTTTVILYGNRVVLIDVHGYLITESRQCLINRVVDHLVNQMVQTLQRDISDIHRRALTHRL